MTQLNLLPESPEERVLRVDAEILWLLMGNASAVSRETLTDAERAVLREIRYRRGIRNAVPIRELVLRTGLTDRQIKGAVRVLRQNFRLPIASSKHSTLGGYYLWITREDLAPWMSEQLDQIRAEIAVFRAAASEEAALDLVKELWAGVQPEKETAA